jgi:hypothetical protein
MSQQQPQQLCAALAGRYVDHALPETVAGQHQVGRVDAGCTEQGQRDIMAVGHCCCHERRPCVRVPAGEGGRGMCTRACVIDTLTGMWAVQLQMIQSL